MLKRARKVFFGYGHLLHFSCQKCFPKTPTDYLSMYTSDSSDDSVPAKRPPSFSEFDFKSTYLQGLIQQIDYFIKFQDQCQIKKSLILMILAIGWMQSQVNSFLGQCSMFK